jgi:hypothetical protein
MTEKEDYLTNLCGSMIVCILIAVAMYFIMRYVGGKIDSFNVSTLLSQDVLKAITDATFFFLPQRSFLTTLFGPAFIYITTVGAPILFVGVMIAIIPLALIAGYIVLSIISYAV